MTSPGAFEKLVEEDIPVKAVYSRSRVTKLGKDSTSLGNVPAACSSVFSGSRETLSSLGMEEFPMTCIA